MKHKQRIELRQSETRERMNELLSKDERTAEDLQELNELSQSMKNLETEKRAAILSRKPKRNNAKHAKRHNRLITSNGKGSN